MLSSSNNKHFNKKYIMKKLIYIFTIIVLFNSCKKDKIGKVLYNIKFTTEEISLKKRRLNTDSMYTQFGDYITSLTPYKFTAHIWAIGYIDRVMEWSGNSANQLEYIEQNLENLSFDDPSRFVDFSNNNIVSFDPVIYGRLKEDDNGRLFEDPEINFKYFYFIPFSFYQEVQLPSQYQNVQLNMFPDPDDTIIDNVLKVKHYRMLGKIFPNANIIHNRNIYFIFGNTDSTFVVNENGEYVGLSENCPIAEPENDLTIRSDKYVNMIFNSPINGGTVVMNGVLSFNTENLIQVYAGVDNVPYTIDDIVVYAPKFWERIYSRLDVN